MGKQAIKINYLDKAYFILRTKGHAQFLGYVNNVDMSQDDIERVLTKHKYRTDPEFRAEINKKFVEPIRKKTGIRIKP